MIIALIGSSLSPVEATEAFTVDEFLASATQVTGSTTMSEQLYVNTDGKIEPVEVKADGTFTVSLERPVDGRTVYFYKKTGEFYQTIWQARESLYYMEFPPPSFYGVKDGKMLLQTHPGIEIVAVYEGETLIGNGTLSIPLRHSTEVRAYTRDGSYERSLTETYRANQTFHVPLEIEPLLPGQNGLAGKTLPFQELRLTIGGRVYSSYSERDGQFRIYADLPFQSFIDGFSAQLEIIHPDKSALRTENMIVPPLVASDEKPYHTVNHSHALEGYTYPNATIAYGDDVIVADETGRFYVEFTTDQTSNKTLTYSQDGQVYATQKLRQAVEPSKFPLTIQTEPSTVSGKFEGKTEPDVTLILKSDQGEYAVTSDANGAFSTELPLFERGTYSVHLKTDTLPQNLGVNVTIQEKRPLAKPTVTFVDDTMHIDATATSPIATEAEVQVTTPDGEIDVKQISLSNGRATILLAEGDQYRIRVKYGNQLSAYVEGVYRQINAPTMQNFAEGGVVIVGKTEPYATVSFYMKRHLHDSPGQLINQKADESGNFSIQLPTALEKLEYRFVIKRQDGTAEGSHLLMPKDLTAPVISINGKDNTSKISEETGLMRLTTDDVITSHEAHYKINGEWVPVDEKYVLRMALHLMPPKPAQTFKEAKVEQIRIQVTNTDGIRTVMTLQVTDTTPPALQLNRILYGEQTITGTTEPFMKVTHGRSGQLDTQIADANGRFTFKLTYPITKYTSNIYPVSVSDEAGNKAVESSYVFDYRIQDIRVNAAGTKLWLANENRRINHTAYELIVNGTQVKLNDYSTLVTLPEPHTFPIDVELRLKNEDGTLKYAFKKTLTKPSTLTTPKQLYAESGKKTIKGQLDPYVSYEIYDGSGKRIKTNVASADGSFASAITRPLIQNEPLRVIAKDPFGQTKSMTFKVTDKTAPARPTVNTLVAPLKNVSGKAEAGSTVRITYRGKTYATKADSTGVYRLVVSNWQAGQAVSVTARDVAGNNSTAAKTTIMNAFKTVSVAPVRTTSTTVTGKADAAAYVRVYVGTRQLGKTMRASSKATFSVAIPKQKKGTVLTVRVSRAGYATVERKVTVY
ncbi:Ig-like domain-containing protein [Exiguobacterium sp. TNDT2]|uniref:Ig-like domain-containing protein n=1 Tax=Exiguobacterium sp. TNDT2 TaxID=2233531 RepID=UPI00130048B7|nr:Ig-like domain-containing protein [Exiguobacterium sp. TNDT2]